MHPWTNPHLRQRIRENFLTKLHPCPGGIAQQILCSKSRATCKWPSFSFRCLNEVSGADKTTLVGEGRELKKSNFIVLRLTRCAAEKPMDILLFGFHPWLASTPTSLLPANRLPANCFTGHWAASCSIRKQKSTNTCYFQCLSPT